MVASSSKLSLPSPMGEVSTAGNASHAGEQIFNRNFLGGGMKNDLVGIFETEGDDIAFLQGLLGGAFAVHKNAQLIPAILQKIVVRLDADRRAIAGDPAIGDSHLVSHFAAADQKWRLGNGHGAARVFRRNEFEDRSFIGGYGVCHEPARRDKCTINIGYFRVRPSYDWKELQRHSGDGHILEGKKV